MKRTSIYVGEDGGMGGYHDKYLIVSLRKDGSVSLRGQQDMSVDGYGSYFPPGKTGLTGVEELDSALWSILYDIGADTVSRWELSEKIRQIAKAWDSPLLARLANHLVDREE